MLERNGGVTGGGQRSRRVPDRGAALVEFALILPVLSLLVFGVIDFARVSQLQNRLSNAAREAGAAVQFAPKSISAGCRNGNNTTDRAAQEEPGLTAHPGYSIEVVKVASGDPAVTGCDTSSVSIVPGDTLRVTVSAEHDLIAPLLGAVVGDPIEVRRSVDVVVQG